MAVFDSIAEFFTTMDFDALIEDLGAIVGNIDFTLIKETLSSLIVTLKDLFAQL